MHGLSTQPDPIGLAGGLNLYGYAGGDPVNYHDPFGLSPLAWIVGVVAAAVVHYARDLFNRPETCDEPEEQQGSGCRERDTPGEKKFHTQGPDNESNRVFESSDGRHEVVVDQHGNVVTDDLNRGTYNYCPMGNAVQTLLHGVCDAAPYILFGNSPRDLFRFGSRIKRLATPVGSTP